jgi:hypothetical protein
MSAIPPLSPRAAARLVAGWLAVRTLAWTLVALTQPNPPLDAVEWLAWGRHWQAGYHKHPPLAAWLAEIASQLTPGSFAGVYLLGYLCVAVALWCVWLVARDVLPPRTAVAATLCLDGLTYLTRDAAEFNNQVVLVAFWALAIWCCWRAAVGGRWSWWAATGAALGASLWCKYTAVFLALSLGAFWLWHTRGKGWTQVAVVAGTCALVFLPHLLWLIGHDFVTLRYAAERVGGESEALDHRASALTFLASQAGRLLPVGLVLLVPLTPPGPPSPTQGRGGEQEPSDGGVNAPLAGSPLSPVWERGAGGGEGRTFLLFAVAGPVALHVAVGVLLGTQLRDIWGVPLWAFAGVLLCSLLHRREIGRRWRLFLSGWAAVAGVMLLVTLAGNVAGAAWRHRPLRVHYPGRQLASEVESRWRREFGSPLPVAAGDWWLAACVCVHGSDRPTLYGSRDPSSVGMADVGFKGSVAKFYAPDPRASPWIDDDGFRRRGGVLLWDAGAFGDELPDLLRERFPEAQTRTPMELPFSGTLGSSRPARTLRVGWAVIAPPRGP